METGLSIIVPSFNSGSVIDLCLKAIDRESKNIDQPYEILVVDSSPNPPELPDISELRLHHSDRQLFASEARNLGARIAKYPVLIFLDSDVEILPGAIERLLNGLGENSDVVGGVYEIHNSRTSRISTYQDFFLLFRYENIPSGKNFFSSGHFSISKKNFLKVGGFSENLQSYEDVDLSFKLEKKFLKASVCFESRGYHLKNFNLISIFNDYYLKTRNMICYRLNKLNNLHWTDTFLTKSMRISYYLIFCYVFLFTMMLVPVRSITPSFWLSTLGLFLVLDIILLAPFLAFVWQTTHRPLWVVGAMVFFKATTIPIVCGTAHGLFSFFRNDTSFINKTKSHPDISQTQTTDYSEKREG